MSAVEAKRTLVKSPPEVWAKVSDPEVLADHLADLGPIQITRVEPESVVLWEGDRATGTVQLEAGGWGTKVTLTAELAEAEVPEPVVVPEPEAEAVVEPEPEPEAIVEPEPEPAASAPEAPAPKRGLFARWFGRRKTAEAPPVAQTPAPAAETPPDPEPAPPDPEPQPDPEPEPGEHPPPHHDAQTALAILEAALDRLGAAHHRPFSRG
jgi:hypothetical protein